jgi:cell wall-associated NlpC family hydrolase
MAVAALVGPPVAMGAASPTGGNAPSGPPTTNTPTTPTTTSTTPTTTTPTGPESGGAGFGAPAAQSTPAHPEVPGFVAEIVRGEAYAPADAPIQVQRAIWAGDRIRHMPYIWGGGHGSFRSDGYDCSGSVSYVLHAAGLLNTPLDSGQFMKWGRRGSGRWITVYASGGHAFIEIAGIRFDTSAEDDPDPPPGNGPRWRPLYADPQGFVVRHPAGF